MADLQEVQFMLEISYLDFIFLDLLLILQVMLDLLFSDLPRVFLLEVCDFSLKLCNVSLVVVLFVPEFALKLEDGFIALLDSQVEIVDDIFGLT